MKKILSLLLLLSIVFMPENNAQSLNEKADSKAVAIEKQVIEWRRHFHENPELSNREFETAKRIAEELTSMGLDVDTPCPCEVNWLCILGCFDLAFFELPFYFLLALMTYCVEISSHHGFEFSQVVIWSHHFLVEGPSILM